jgi:drug/metabolite transporter (DMT)-like permease
MAGRRDRLDFRAMVLMLVCCVVWGFTQVAIKLTLPGISPLFGAGLRSLASAALVAAWCALRGLPLRIGPGVAGHALAIGLLFGGEFVFLYLGLTLTPASHAIMFLYTTPFLVSIGAHFLLPDEPLTARKLLGLALAFAGLGVAVADGLSLPTGRALLGDLLELLAAALWAATILVIKRRADLPITPVQTLFYQLAVSAPFLLACAWLLGEPGVTRLTPIIVGAFLYQVVVVAGLSYLTWFWLLERYPASHLAAFSFVTPIFGVVAAGLVLGERITGELALAVALVAAGLYVVNSPRPARARPVICPPSASRVHRPGPGDATPRQTSGS